MDLIPNHLQVTAAQVAALVDIFTLVELLEQVYLVKEITVVLMVVLVLLLQVAEEEGLVL